MAFSSFPPLLDRPHKRGRTEEVFKFFGHQVDNFPRFHVIHSEKTEKSARIISPFLVAKSLIETFGPGYKVSKLASGDLLLELRDKMQYEKLPKLVSFGAIPVSVTPHRSMNTIRGVISDDDLMELTETELLEGWSDQNVINVKRIKMRRDGKEIQTKHLILTFGSSVLPEIIETGYVKIRVRPYIPNPLRCFKCQRFGHSSQNCRGRITCAKCADEHPSESCENAPHCVNCDGEHAAYSRSCPSWKKEKEIVTIKVKENISFREARRRVSYLPKNSFAEVARQGAAPQRPLAAARPAHSEPAVTPSAPSAAAASAAPPSQKKGPSTSGLVASRVSSLETRPPRPTQRLQERVSSALQEAMDTTTSQTAPSVERIVSDPLQHAANLV
ncbi:uncharacterized protein LOC125945682 [Dermacentor silvarum]|uniref:uncharacterized protein LOC125945682 n=1 Tax=Dermacentor silvarum TaxID=543639 RepID=UPI002101105D|nr:uncharacterized protein LOC125945682 [Dermacentor silvarum]